MKKILYIGIVLLGMSGCTHAFEGVEDNTPVGNMESLWRTIDQKYCFVEEKNVDWQMVHDTILPKVQLLQADDYLGLFDVLGQMLNELKDGHVNLMSSFDVSSYDGWYAPYAENFDWTRIESHYVPNYRTAGGLYYAVLPDTTIGYVYCPSFENAISGAHMAYILRSMRNCQGMIVDVRNNGGGSLEYAHTLAATFFDSTQVVGYWQHKNGVEHDAFSKIVEQKIDAEDMGSKWLRPVVVITNRRSYSATNFFISAMRYAQRSTLVGDKSGGGGGMPLSYELPNGWMVRFSSIRMMDKEYHSIEEGIAPDIYVTQVSEEKDDLIEKAIEVIHKYYQR